MKTAPIIVALSLFTQGLCWAEGARGPSVIDQACEGLKKSIAHPTEYWAAMKIDNLTALQKKGIVALGAGSSTVVGGKIYLNKIEADREANQLRLANVRHEMRVITQDLAKLDKVSAEAQATIDRLAEKIEKMGVANPPKPTANELLYQRLYGVNPEVSKWQARVQLEEMQSKATTTLRSTEELKSALLLREGDLIMDTVPSTESLLSRLGRRANLAKGIVSAGALADLVALEVVFALGRREQKLAFTPSYFEDLETQDLPGELRGRDEKTVEKACTLLATKPGAVPYYVNKNAQIDALAKSKNGQLVTAALTAQDKKRARKLREHLMMNPQQWVAGGESEAVK